MPRYFQKCVVIIVSAILFLQLTETRISLDVLSNLVRKRMKSIGYNRHIRPVQFSGDIVNVSLIPMINHVQFNENAGTMSATLALLMFWNDHRLPLTFEDYKNDTHEKLHGFLNPISMDTRYIWSPYIDVVNSAKISDGLGMWKGHYNSKLWISSATNKTVTVYSHRSMDVKVTCFFDFTNFPYDTQKCPIVFADMFYSTMNKVNVTSHGTFYAFMSEYDDSRRNVLAGWSFKNPIPTKNVFLKYYDYRNRNIVQNLPADTRLSTWISAVEFWVVCSRHQPYAFLIYVFPLILTSIVTIMSLSVALFPPLAIYSILIQSVFILILSVSIPSYVTSLPRIIKFYATNMVLSFIVLFFQCFMLSMENWFRHMTSAEWFINLEIRVSKASNMWRTSRIVLKPRQDISDDERILTETETGSKPKDFSEYSSMIQKMMLFLILIVYFLSFVILLF